MFDRATAQRFLDAILSRGGSRDALEAFVEFRGRRPDVRALLRQHGIDHAGELACVSRARAGALARRAAGRSPRRPRHGARRDALRHRAAGGQRQQRPGCAAASDRHGEERRARGAPRAPGRGRCTCAWRTGATAGSARATCRRHAPLRSPLAQRDAEVARLQEEVKRLAAQPAAARSPAAGAAAPQRPLPRRGALRLQRPPAARPRGRGGGSGNPRGMLFAGSAAERPVRVWPWALGGALLGLASVSRSASCCSTATSAASTGDCAFTERT